MYDATTTTADTPTTETPGRPKLERRKNNRVIAGVCDAIGRHLGIDPLVVRLAFVLSTLVSGIGVVAYAVAWYTIPATDES